MAHWQRGTSAVCRTFVSPSSGVVFRHDFFE
jgi:hypothetical protein